VKYLEYDIIQIKMKEKIPNSYKEIETLSEETKSESEKIIKEENQELEEYKRLAEERLNQLKYLQADFDNYRKRFDKEKDQIIQLANENLIKELIVLLDDFESSVKLIENNMNKEGVELLQKKFFNILERHGLKEIEALGKRFNPNFHEVLCKELSKHDEDEILEEMQKGYLLCSKVIRPSKVKVSKGLKELDKINKETKPENKEKK
jgi:molecular chaperone GrpE